MSVSSDAGLWLEKLLLHVGFDRQELSPGARDEDFGFWQLSLVSISQYNQGRGSCAIAEAAQCSISCTKHV